MTTAVETHPAFIHNSIPKSSNYLYYWAQNIDSETRKDIQTLSNLNSIKAMQRQQMRKFQNQITAQEYLISDATGIKIDAIGQLYDVGVLQQNLNQLLEPNNVRADKPAVATSDLNDILVQIRALQIDKLNSDVNKFIELVTQFIETKLRPTNQDLQTLSTALLLKYAQQTGIASDKTSFLTVRQTSQVNERIARDVLGKMNGKLFKADKDDIQGGLDNTMKKIILSLSAIQAVGNGTANISRAYVTHGSSKAKQLETGKYVSGADNILQELASKIYQSVSYVNRVAAEASELICAANAHIKGLQELSKLEIKATSHGNKYINVDIRDYEKNETFLKIAEEAQQNLTRLQKQVSKSDGGIRFYQGDTVIAEAGFNVKTSEELLSNPKGVSNVTIKIQDGTPLSTLLAREAHISSSQYLALIQALVVHGDDAYYEQIWRNMKQVTTEMAFVRALTGLNKTQFSVFFVLNNKVGKVIDLLRLRLADGGGLRSIMNLSDSNIDGTLERSEYQKINQWLSINPKMKNSASPQLALKRSQNTFTKASQLLYQTKIRIDMNLTGPALSMFQ